MPGRAAGPSDPKLLFGAAPRKLDVDPASGVFFLAKSVSADGLMMVATVTREHI